MQQSDSNIAIAQQQDTAPKTGGVINYNIPVSSYPTPSSLHPQLLQASSIEDSEEYRVLTEKHKAFVLALIKHSFKQTLAGNEIYGTRYGSTRASKLMCHNLRVQACVRKARSLLVKSAVEQNIWSYEMALMQSKKMLLDLQKEYENCVLEYAGQPGNIKKEKTRIAKAMEFWKDNLDKMHGYLKENVSAKHTVEFTELSGLSADELQEFAGKVRALKEKKLVESKN